LANAADRDGAERSARMSAGTDKAEVLEDIADILGGVAAVHIASIHASPDLADDRCEAADDLAASAEERARVREALSKLPTKERRLMELYYFGDMSLDSAGAKLGLSKSWASRLHARAIGYLREALGGEGDPAE